MKDALPHTSSKEISWSYTQFLTSHLDSERPVVTSDKIRGKGNIVQNYFVLPQTENWDYIIWSSKTSIQTKQWTKNSVRFEAVPDTSKVAYNKYSECRQFHGLKLLASAIASPLSSLKVYVDDILMNVDEACLNAFFLA